MWRGPLCIAHQQGDTEADSGNIQKLFDPTTLALHLAGRGTHTLLIQFIADTKGMTALESNDISKGSIQFMYTHRASAPARLVVSF